MKSIFPLITFFLLTEALFAQQSKCCIPLENGKDTAFWYKWSQENIAKNGLPNLLKTIDSLHYRFRTQNQVIDIWTNDFKYFNGTVTNYTTAVPDGNQSKGEGKFYSETKMIESRTTKLIDEIFNSLGIFNVPPQSDIVGWEDGSDGGIVIIECSTPTKYSFKSYWTPSLFKNIKEAITIDSLSKTLNAMLARGYSWANFLHRLPKGCYTNDGAFLVCTDIPIKRKKRR